MRSEFYNFEYLSQQPRTQTFVWLVTQSPPTKGGRKVREEGTRDEALMTSVWEATIVAVFLMYSVLLPFVGEKGDRGDIGQEGISGLQGDPGSEGARGAQGPPGPKGEKGNQGVDGVQGEKGT